jgi:o-succinylbenzoate synthase
VRIAAARVRLQRLEFARPVRTSLGEFTERRSVMLTLTDAEDRVGLGEAAPWPGFGTESVEESLAALEDAGRMLVDTDIEPGDWPSELALCLRNASAARAAVQGALWDLAARQAGRPLSELLARHVTPFGGAGLSRVASHALLIEREPDALRDEAARARSLGFRAVKIKLGAARLDDDVARARAAREGIGPDLRLRGDANGAWTESAAIEAIDALAGFNLDFVEQPLPAGELAGLGRLRRRSAVRIALDESVATEEGALRAIATGAGQVCVLKPATLGGPARAFEIAAMARDAGCEVVFTHAFESAVGARHALHCAAAFGEPQAIHGLCTQGLFTRDIAEPVVCAGGTASLSKAPGLGITP